MWTHFSALYNTLGDDNFDNFVAFLLEINHNKTYVVVIKQDYKPGKGSKWIFDKVYQDDYGAKEIDIDNSDDIVTYLNALENNNDVHNNDA